jgi:hypothetical protein
MKGTGIAPAHAVSVTGPVPLLDAVAVVEDAIVAALREEVALVLDVLPPLPVSGTPSGSSSHAFNPAAANNAARSFRDACRDKRAWPRSSPKRLRCARSSWDTAEA